MEHVSEAGQRGGEVADEFFNDIFQLSAEISPIFVDDKADPWPILLKKASCEKRQAAGM